MFRNSRNTVSMLKNTNFPCDSKFNVNVNTGRVADQQYQDLVCTIEQIE